jgi:two-component system nitrogen regulation response regulator GlnG
LAAGVGPTILPEDLPDELLREKDIEMREEIDSAPLSEVECDKLLPFIENAIANGDKDLYRRVINFVDRILISLAMRRAGGKQVRAAEILGMSRVTLRAKLRVANDSSDCSDREVHRQEQD